MKNCLKKWIPVILWMMLIFFLSAQPDLESGLPFVWDFILRKFAHIFEYLILCLLFFYALFPSRSTEATVVSLWRNVKRNYLKWFGRTKNAPRHSNVQAQEYFESHYCKNMEWSSCKKAIYLSVFFSFIYAISDEYHQRFIFGRCGCIRDVFIDSVGILIGYWIIKMKMVK